MEHELHVYIDIARQPILVGRLWVRERQDRETCTFIYDASWLNRSGSFALAPALMLTPGPHHSDNGLLPAFTDPAPDRWGQKLMRHHERARAAASGNTPRKLFDSDFLMGVDDEIRLGALRFKSPQDPQFMASSGNAVPQLIDLRKLLSASDRLEKGKERKGDLALLLAPGGSLGGARPKAVVRDKDRTLHLAKFPWQKDDWSVILWETVTLELARAAAIDIPAFKLVLAGTKPVLMLGRFDRQGVDVRLPFMSAMTALGAKDRDEEHSYLEIVDALRQFGGEPEKDIAQLWRRMVFNILVSNTDDHLRNHGFLMGDRGWRLAPAYDMNPCPEDIGKRIHVLAINDEERTGSLDVALSVADYFGLKRGDAKVIASEVGAAVSRWKEAALAHGIPKSEIEVLQSAFAHRDLDQALAHRQAEPTKTLKAPKATKVPKDKRKKTERITA